MSSQAQPRILILARLEILSRAQLAAVSEGRSSVMLIPLLANTASTPDIGSIIGQVAGGGVAGAVLTAIVGAIKNKTA
jgi:hypothetical protein